MSDINISIRQSGPADSPLAIFLIRLSMGEEVEWLFGQGKSHSTQKVLTELYHKKANRLSHEYSSVGEINGRFSGLLIAYPGKRLRPLEIMTGVQLLGIFGILETMRVARRTRAYGKLVEAKPDEFYISNLAVFQEDQGRGVGKALLTHAETLARTNGLKKCSLIVTYDNPAKSLYERFGYQLDQSTIIHHPILAHGSGGYHRMVKVLSPAVDTIT